MPEPSGIFGKEFTIILPDGSRLISPGFAQINYYSSKKKYGKL
jgi:hypothetical protein